MRNFFRFPLFRCLVCLILVCCILVNVSPIRADALAVGAGVSAVVGTALAVTVVAGAMQALGVMPDSTDTSVFEGVVNDCVDALTASGVFLNGMVSVLQLSDGVVVKNHVNQGIIQAILDWLFAEEIVNLIEYNWVTSWTGSFGSDELVVSSSYPFVPVVLTYSYPFGSSTSSTTCLYYYFGEFTSTSSYFTINGRSKNISVLNGNGWYCYSTQSNPISYVNFTGIDASQIFDAGYVDSYSAGLEICQDAVITAISAGSIGIASGLVAGQIGTEVETDYETWVEDGVIAVDFGIGYVDDPNTNQDDDNEDEGETGGDIATIPPDEIVDPNNPVQPSTSPSPWWHNKWLNIGLQDLLAYSTAASLGTVVRNLLDQTQTQTQTQVADPQYKVDTSLFGNGGNGNNVITPPDTSDPDSTTPTDPSDPSVSGDLAGYTFNLNKIFPFCIPFDLYDFLTCLDATPVAPVINWELQLPGGSTYPITVDLSPFDSVAQLLRRLELLVFTIALAIKTRDLIKG